MMKENSFKSDESNRKRLESLKQQAEEFKLKKSLIKNSLNSLVIMFLFFELSLILKVFKCLFYQDGDSKPKKIIFKDSDSDTEIVTKKAKQGGKCVKFISHSSNLKEILFPINSKCPMNLEKRLVYFQLSRCSNVLNSFLISSCTLSQLYH